MKAIFRGVIPGVSRKCIAESLAIFMAVLLPATALGQSTPPSDPLISFPDGNSVDVLSSSFVVRYPSAEVGSADLKMQWNSVVRSVVLSGPSTNPYAPARDCFTQTIKITSNYFVISLNESQRYFNRSDFQPTDKMGGSLTYDSPSKVYTFTDRDGITYIFDTMPSYDPTLSTVKTIIKPNGETITMTRDGTASNAITSVNSNTGYQIKYYADPAGSFSTISAINNTIEYCTTSSAQCSLSHSWPTLTSNSAGLTDVTGGVTVYNAYLNPSAGTGYASITFPGYSTPNISAVLQSIGTFSAIKTLTINGQTWTYPYPSNTMVIKDPLGRQMTVTKDTTTFQPRPGSVTDANGHTTSYTYDFEGRLRRTTFPEGNYEENTVDGRGNVTQLLKTPKPGSTLANIVTSSNFDATCVFPAKCNKPNWTRDALGNQTDYTYDNVHGGILTVMQPAPTPGAARPLSLTTWAQRYAWILNSSGVPTQAASPIWMMATVTECQTAVGSSNPVCDNSAPKTVTTYEYGAPGTSESLLVKGEVVASDGVALRTCYGYDIYHRRISETKPNANLGACP